MKCELDQHESNIIETDPNGSQRYYPVNFRRSKYAIGTKADAGEVLYCRGCQRTEHNPRYVENAYCPKCNQFLDPDAPLGRIPMINANWSNAAVRILGEAILLPPPPPPLGLEEAAAMCMDAIDRDDVKDVPAQAAMHWARESLPELVALAQYFEIDNFPDDAEAFTVPTSTATHTMIVHGSIGAEPIIIRQRDGTIVLDSTDWEEGARTWSITFTLDWPATEWIQKRVLELEDNLPSAPTVQELLSELAPLPNTSRFHLIGGPSRG